MTTLLSSEAVFDEKAAECGVSAAVLAEIKRQNINNLGTLAFSAGQPGQVATDDMLARLCTIGGIAPTVGVLGSVRRLVFISQSLAVADMKQMDRQSLRRKNLHLQKGRQGLHGSELNWLA